MKIILTEHQLELIRLNEGNNFADKLKDDISKLKTECDKLYNLITYSTIAEIRDGESDIPVYGTKVERIQDVVYSMEDKILNYFERFDEDTLYAKKLDEVENDLNNRIRTVSIKASALEAMIEQLLPFSRLGENSEGRDNDWDSPFDNITSVEI